MNRFVLLIAGGLSAAAPAPASFYLTTSAYYLDVHGTPDIGDIGHAYDTEGVGFVPQLTVGKQINPWVSLELSAIYIDSVSSEKVSPHFSPFPPPPGSPVLPALLYYRLQQRSTLAAFSVPLSWQPTPRLALSFVPSAHQEWAVVTLDQQIGVLPTLPLSRDRVRFLRRSENRLGWGASLRGSYKITEGVRIYGEAGIRDLHSYEARLFGGGVSWSF